MKNSMPRTSWDSGLHLSRRRAVALAVSAMAVATQVTRSAAHSDPSATPSAAEGGDSLSTSLSMPSVLAADASPEFRAVAGAVVAALQQHQVPGAALGILAGDREEHAAFGVASRASLAPVGPDTLFQIGSLSKTFTATAIWRLIDAGALSLDAPVRTYLPEFRLADEATAAEVTVAHLLTHTGGWLGDNMPSDPDGGDDAIARYVSTVMPALPQLFPLGEFFSYNNAGFMLLGRLIEVATGTTYDAAMRNMIFGPLGLGDTILAHADVLRRSYADGHFFGPVNGQEILTVLTPLWIPRAVNPTGGIWSTTRDLIRYARFHLDPGTVAGSGRLVQPESLMRMQTPAKSMPGRPASIGMSWLIQEVEGVRAIQHPGATLGQNSDFVVIPEQRFAFTLLTNGNSGGAVTRDVLNAALATYPGLAFLSGKVGMTQILAADPGTATVDLPAETLAEYAGRYATELQTLNFEATDGGMEAINTFTTPQDLWQPDIPAPPVDAAGAPPAPVTFAAEDEALAFGQRLPFVRDASGQVGWAGWRMRLLPRENPA
jgi:CubicO group peptidase (beta-lactamase class C family)